MQHLWSEVESFLENPKCPLWVDSCHSAIARQSLIKRLLHPRGTPTCPIWFHLHPIHTILDERLGIFEAYDDQLE
jgi:hypothetical protein